MGGHMRKTLLEWLFSEGNPQPGDGCGFVLLPTVVPLPGLGGGAGTAWAIWPQPLALVGLHPHVLLCVSREFRL